MEVTHLFSGNALGAVDEEGRVRLPPFILREMERHGDGARLLFGVHETDPCLTGYAPLLKPRLHAELERRRLRDEESGRGSDVHHQRARRMFGLVEETNWDDLGTIALPPIARRRGRIGEQILFIGTGESFEMWDPGVALAEGGEEVREVAEFRLGRAGADRKETGR